MRLLAPSLLVLALTLGPAWAEQTPQQRLTATQRQMEAAQTRTQNLAAEQTKLDDELKGLRNRLISATDTADRSEKDLAELESSLADLEGTAARRSVMLAAQREELSETLALLQRLALMPPAAQILEDTPPIDRLRRDMQIKALLPEIEKRSKELADTVADLRLLQQRLTDKRGSILREQRTLSRQQDELNKLMAERTTRLASTRALHTREQQRAERLGKEAQDLRELLERMEREQAEERARIERERVLARSADLPDAEELAPAPQRSARALPSGTAKRLPVSASASLRFGEKDEFGNVSKGITLRPRPGAVVAAVADGRVAFAGPFRGYGRVLILEHAGGYHTVLAGIGRVTVEVGQKITAGEPLGNMGEQREPAPELYFEVRQNGAPVDPLGTRATRLTSAR